MHVAAVTGGAGSGKSTFVSELAKLGAQTIDVDALGRNVIQPDGRAYTPIIEAFGADIVGDDGQILRPALASIVFSDPEELARLNAISHPAINAELEELLAAMPSDAIVVLDMAVLVESNLAQRPDGPMYDTVIVVEAPVDVRVNRLIGRGLTEDDARNRIASQATDDERRAVADHVITNSGHLTDLAESAREIWTLLLATRTDG